MEIVDNWQDVGIYGQYVLGVMAKEPRVGTVKTRLCPPLSPEEAAALYAVSLEETLERLEQGTWRTVVFYAGDRAYFARTFPALPLFKQRGADLGERMANALNGLLAGGARAAVLVGSDSPDLPLDHVAQAFEQLEHSQAVLAPALDGGYILIGESRHCPQLFSGIAWSSAQVLTQTRLRAAQASISLSEIDFWEDLDDAAALHRLQQRSPATRTAHFIQTQLAHHGIHQAGGR